MLIAASGAVTAAGSGIERISAALRAPVNVFGREDVFPSRATGQPLLLAAAEPLDRLTPWEGRMAWLAEQAAAPVRQRIAVLQRHADWPARLPVFLSLPPPRPGMAQDFHRRFAPVATNRLTVARDDARSAIVRSGQDGAVCCLQEAAKVLATERPMAAIVGGVDSWIDIDMLHWLETQRRLKGPDVPNGIVPGEGAAFLLLVNAALAVSIGFAGGVACCGMGRSSEPNPWYAQRTSLAEGLTRALQAALAGQARTDITLCDMNGESWRADEWSFAYVRTARFHSEPLNLWHPADTWGDTGAAAGALLAALAAHELRRDRALQRALVWCACDVTPYRGALVLQRNPGETP